MKMSHISGRRILVSVFIVFVTTQTTEGQTEECSPGSYMSDGTCLDCGSNCHRRVCEAPNGSCTYGCKSGFYGERCENNCTNCDKPNLCDRISGVCLYGCIPGYYGGICNLHCNNCMNNTCEQESGNCFDGCIPGFFEVKCDKNCSENCRYQTCEQTSGACNDGGCIDGFYGANCSEQCNPKCKDLKCFQDGGDCVEGCEMRWTGRDCNDCADGWYGTNCEMNCNTNCNAGCRRDTGECTNGCSVPGVQPPWCVEACPLGLFGINCRSNCSIHCLEEFRCVPVNGTCWGGCREGYKGHDCQTDGTNEDYGNKEVIAGAVIGSILGFLLIILLICLLVRRKRKQRDEKIKDRKFDGENQKENGIDAKPVHLNDVDKGRVDENTNEEDTKEMAQNSDNNKKEQTDNQ
ncbi:scavenger receptor class F member 2-like isoform X2 [Saccostrea echinata]|uniref:scavenger receptor class F member 2-like isoform X2 n=1 Tax=Saccostrea echinata TaxID=191078 RepID=UPI002A8334E1|nr:scavenger receptor class F member 2-like isoform X2 [Saccostrea echinata]